MLVVSPSWAATAKVAFVLLPTSKMSFTSDLSDCMRNSRRFLVTVRIVHASIWGQTMREVLLAL